MAAISSYHLEKMGFFKKDLRNTYPVKVIEQNRVGAILKVNDKVNYYKIKDILDSPDLLEAIDPRVTAKLGWIGAVSSFSK